MGEHPGERERCGIPALLERLERIEHVVAPPRLVRVRPQRHPRARGERLATPVLASQPAAAERAERLEADAVLCAERQHLLLRLAREQRVLVLHYLDARERQRLPEVSTVDVRKSDGPD